MGQRLRSAAFDEMLRIIREEEPPRPSLRLSSVGFAHRQNGGTGGGQSPAYSSLASVAALRKTEPAKLVRLVRGELDWIAMKALEKDRSRRYETANAFAADIERYLRDEAVQACPPSAAYRFRKFVRRNKGPVAAVSLVLLALVAGIIGTTWGLVRAEKAHQQAHAAQLAEADRAEGERRARDEAQKAFVAERKARESEARQRQRAEHAAEVERKAKEAESVQRQRAEDNVKLAIAVLDEIFTQEALDRLKRYSRDEPGGIAQNPERQKRERQLLEKGLKFYEQLAQGNASDWRARRERAKAYGTVGLIELDLKDYAASEKAYRQAVPLLEGLAAERPADFDNRLDLASA